MASIQQVTQQLPVTEDDAGFGASADLTSDLLHSCLCPKQRKPPYPSKSPTQNFGSFSLCLSWGKQRNKPTKQNQPGSVCDHFTVWFIGFGPSRERRPRCRGCPGMAGNGRECRARPGDAPEAGKRLQAGGAAVPPPGSRGGCRAGSSQQLPHGCFGFSVRAELITHRCFQWFLRSVYPK